MSDWQDEYDDALLKRGHIAGLREAAVLLTNRIDREAIFENKHKANGKHYKAREAAHVQRILNEERNNILAHIAELEKTNGS